MKTHTATTPKDVLLSDLLGIPARMSIPAAGRLVAGLSRARSYELHQQGAFPVPVQKVGSRYHVRGADVLRALGFDAEAVLLGARVESIEAASHD